MITGCVWLIFSELNTLSLNVYSFLKMRFFSRKKKRSRVRNKVLHRRNVYHYIGETVILRKTRKKYAHFLKVRNLTCIWWKEKPVPQILHNNPFFKRKQIDYLKQSLNSLNWKVKIVDTSKPGHIACATLTFNFKS